MSAIQMAFRPHVLMLIALLALILPPAADARDAGATSGWAVHHNERFGISLRYPARVFGLERSTEVGDGHVFVAHEGGARLLVGALVNTSRFTPAAYQGFVEKESYSRYTIGYRRLAANWFVLSGEGSNRIFYEKVMFTCQGRLISSFAMTYPADQRHVYDPIVEGIEDTFRPAHACPETAGVPAITPSPFPQARGPRLGPRSALADRIARHRGRNVTVILRRTGPPYDYKVLRGYVSRP